MLSIDELNQLDETAVKAELKNCASVTAWIQAIVSCRPFENTTELMAVASAEMNAWHQAELDEAMQAHPRIGEKKAGTSQEAKLSAQEQALAQTGDAAVLQAIQQGNQAYEAKFGRIFLIRAKGRTSEQILAELQRRLTLTPEQETLEAVSQLREITLLRLEGLISK